MNREIDDDEWPEIERIAIGEIRPQVVQWLASMRANGLSFYSAASVINDAVRICLVEAKYAENDRE